MVLCSNAVWERVDGISTSDADKIKLASSSSELRLVRRKRSAQVIEIGSSNCSW